MRAYGTVAIALAVAVAGTAVAKRDKVDFSTSPGRFVGRLKVEREGLSARCTATLVAYDIILTAAHCLAKSEKIFDGRVTPEGATFELQYSDGEFIASSRLETAVTSADYEKLAVPIHGGDWALARLREPLGRKFGYLEVANVILPVGHAVQALGYSKGGQEEHPGIDADCKIGEWDTDTAKLFRSLGIPTGGFFMTSCDIDSGASGGPTVAMVDYTDSRGVKEKVMRVFAINSALDRKAVKAEKTIATAVIALFRNWGAVALYGHMDELHRRYAGTYPKALLPLWKTTLDKWSSMDVKERRHMLYNGLSSDSVIPEALRYGRELEKANRESVVQRYTTGLTFDGEYAPLTVTAVERGSAADDAGMKKGDRIAKCESEKFPSLREFIEGVNASDGRALVRFLRDKKEETVVLKLPKK